jgi:hypothetical protein
MSEDLVTWLRAQLDEDERVAVACRAADGIGSLCGWVEMVTDESEAGEAHAKRWSPDRVLAEVEAKRRIVDEHSQDDGDPGGVCPTCYGIAPVDAPCPTVRLLALPYAGRDGWREEWRA